MSVSNGLRYTVPNATREEIMISLLVPPSLMGCVVFADDKIDFASTVHDDREFGCALGVNDCSLDVENGVGDGTYPPPSLEHVMRVLMH